MSYLPQENPYVQYIGDGVKVAFDFDFTILRKEDVSVYVTLKGETPNPKEDKKVLDLDYRVVKLNKINFKNKALVPADCVITILRDMALSIDTAFNNSASFDGQDLDDAFERIVLISQQISSEVKTSALQYVPNEIKPKNTAIDQNYLPSLFPGGDDGYIWVSQGTSIIAAKADGGGGDAALLRSELASKTEGSSGSRLIGYFNPEDKRGATLNDVLNKILARISYLEKHATPTGTIIFSGSNIIPDGFLLCDGREVLVLGYPELFNVIGHNFGDSNSTDKFRLPDLRRRVPVGSGGDGSNTLGNVIGSTGGEETHTQSVDELAKHYHTPLNPGDRFIAKTGRYTGESCDGSVIRLSFDTSTAETGSSKPFNIIQPSLILNAFIKT